MNHVYNELTEPGCDPPFHTKIRHPACINFLLRQGIPDDTDTEGALAIIARYMAAKGLDEKQGERMAQTMMRNTLCLSITKAKQSDMGTRALLGRRKDHRVSDWSCKEVLSSKRLRECRICTGWRCEHYSLGERGEPHPQSRADEVFIEQALLTYVLNNPESVVEGLQLGIQSEFFVGAYICRDGAPLLLNRVLWHICCHLTRRAKEIRPNTVLDIISRHSVMRPYITEITSYVREIATRVPCSHTAFLEHLIQVREHGIEQHTQALIYAASLALRSRALPPDIILRTLEDQMRALSLTIDDAVYKLDDDLDRLIGAFFAREHRAIPTSSSWVNIALGGGWKPGSVYAVYAACAREATDFAAWCIDQAAWRSHPTLYVSYGKSRDGIGLGALTRHSGVELNDLSAQGERIHDSAEGKTMLEQIISGGERLSKRIAQHVWTLEADDQTATADIMRAARTIQYHGGSGQSKPELLLIDHLPITTPYERDRASSNSRRRLVGTRSVLTVLKRSMRNTKVAIIAIFVPDQTSNKGRSSGNSTSSAVSLVHPKERSAADYTLTLHSYSVRVESLGGKKIVDQFDIAREWYMCRYPEYHEYIQRRFDALRGEYFGEATCRYARVSFREKGGSVQSNPLILYEPSLHRFQSSDIEPMNFEEKIRQFPKTYDDGAL